MKGEVIPDLENKCVKVVLTSQGGNPIRYTLDGSVPDKGSALYKDTLVISETCVLTAVSERKGLEPKYFVKAFDFHKASGRPVTMLTKPHSKFVFNSPYNLLDGVRAADIYKSGEWAGWRTRPFEVVIDMEGSDPYSSVTLGTLIVKASYMFNPMEMTVMTSEDGEVYTEVAHERYEPVAKGTEDGVMDVTLGFPETSARYLKVSAKAFDRLPDWHFAPDRMGELLIDEVMVR